jgi:hypothetical protein
MRLIRVVVAGSRAIGVSRLSPDDIGDDIGAIGVD